MQIVPVETARPYEIHIGAGLLDRAGRQIADILRPKAEVIVLVTDERVDDLYGATVAAALTSAGRRVCRYRIPRGEASKSFSILSELLEFLAESSVTRSDLLVALGGGVVGDLTGFAAAVYQRGIDYVQVPTTFLAAIDSSVGGKTAVNLSAGKNLAGAFWQPRLVLCDTNVIRDLPREIFLDGAAEAVKYGILQDPLILERMAGTDPRADLEDTIRRCVSIKREMVAGDEFDIGARQLLNLGHTAAHAIEKLSNYQIRHGQAVAMGLAIAARAADGLGCSEEPCGPAVQRALREAGLPWRSPCGAEALAAAAYSDKKRAGDTVTIVLPLRIGACTLKTVPVESLTDFFQKGVRSDG